MRLGWTVWGLTFVCGLACDRGHEHSAPVMSAPRPSPAVPSGSLLPSAAPSSTQTTGACRAQIDYLIAPGAFEAADFVRALVADGQHVYLGTSQQVFRVPIAGGKPEPVAEAPWRGREGDAGLWFFDDRLVALVPDRFILRQLPEAGGKWRHYLHAAVARRHPQWGADVLEQSMMGEWYVARKIIFDDAQVHWLEVPVKAKNGYYSTWAVRSAGRKAGPARSVYSAPRPIKGLVRAGDHLIFMAVPASARSETPWYEVLSELALRDTDMSLMSVPVGGGDAVALGPSVHWTGAHQLLFADGATAYIASPADEDPQRLGVWAVDVTGRSEPRLLRSQVPVRAGLIGADRLLFVGTRPAVEAGEGTSLAILTADRGESGTLRQIFCALGDYETHALAVSGGSLLVSMSERGTNLASVARLPLP